MIHISALKKNYGKVTALKGVDLTVGRGQIVGLAGHNGCGKTTLIKCILGLVVPTSGSISVLGEPTLSHFQYRHKIGYMSQNADFPGNLSIIEIFSLLEDLRGVKAARKKELIEYFEIESILERKTNGLSGGTKQRLAAVIAMMFDPEIIILDEPTAGLDPVLALKLKNLILAESKKQKGILLVSHIMSEIEQLVSHLYFLNEGLVQIKGDVQTIKEQTKSSTLEAAVVELMKSGRSHTNV